MTDNRSVWWLWPHVPVVVVSLATLLAAAAIPESTYERAWRTQKELGPSIVVIMVAGVVALIVGTLVAGLAERDPRGRPGAAWPVLSGETATLLRRAYPVLIGLTFIGYGTWLGNGLRNGLSMTDIEMVLASQDNFKLPIKEKLETLPGFTTLTQVAIAAVIVGVVVDLHRPSAAVRWTYRFVVLLAAARALLLAERLAVAELLVPIMILRAAALGHRLRGGPRALLGLAPLLGLFILLGGFAASEYSRSWNWYADRTDQSFVGFASERLLGYYATSHNNGALMIEHGRQVGNVPYYTTTFFWEIPPGSQLGGDLVEDASGDRGRLLRDFANPEFNSPSGIASVFSDYGVGGGIAFFFGTGLVVGALHLSFLHGRVLGVLLYPIAFTGLLELPRYLYWFQGRAVPAIGVAILMAGYLAAKARRRLRWRSFGQPPLAPRPVGT